MSVRELIQILLELDPSARVVVRGYEGGVDDVDEVEAVQLELDANTEDYYGQHEVTGLPTGARAYQLSGSNKLAV